MPDICKKLSDCMMVLDGESLPIIPQYAFISEEEFKKLWQGGSIHYPEALVLYNFVRHFKPRLIVEAGAFVGMSSIFLLAGLKDNGEGGHLISIDRQSVASRFMLDRHGAARSSLVKGQDRNMTTIVTCKAQDFLPYLPDRSVDMFFEDASHTERDTREICSEAVRVLRPGGILTSHDALMETVQSAYKAIGIYQNTSYMGCGLSLWRKREC